MKQILLSSAIVAALKELGSAPDPEIERIMDQRWPAIESKIVETIRRGRLYIPDVTDTTGMPEGCENVMLAYIRKRLPENASVTVAPRYGRRIIDVRFPQEAVNVAPETKAQRAA